MFTYFGEMVPDTVFLGMGFLGEVVHQRIGFHEDGHWRLAERIGPVVCCVRLAYLKNGVVDHFIDGTQDGVIKVAIYVGMNHE